MQVGAAFVLPTADAPITRVPVGLAAYLIPSQVPENRALHAHAALTDAQPDDSVYSQYGLPSAGRGAALAISDMHFKPVQQGVGSEVGIPAAGSVAKATAESSPLYAVQWQVANGLAGSSSQGARLSCRQSLIVSERGGSSVRLPADSPSAAGGMLQKVQGMGPRDAIHLGTRGVHADRLCGPGGVRVSVAAAIAVGLSRVVAQEMPTATVTHLDSGPAACFGASEGAAGLADGGVQLHPLLTAVPKGRSAMPARLGMGDGVMVSGGLGDIGSLLTAWVGSEAPGCRLWLMGRSGRGRVAPGLMLTDCCITAIACDAASPADMEGARFLTCQVCAAPSCCVMS